MASHPDWSRGLSWALLGQNFGKSVAVGQLMFLAIYRGIGIRPQHFHLHHDHTMALAASTRSISARHQVASARSVPVINKPAATRIRCQAASPDGTKATQQVDKRTVLAAGAALAAGLAQQ